MVKPLPGRSTKLMFIPLAITDGPSLVTITVKLVVPPATTVASFAALLILNVDSRTTGIGGVSDSSSSGSFSGSLSGSQTVMPLVIVSPASASTSADTTTVFVPPTGISVVVDTVAVLPVPTTVALLPVISYPVMDNPLPGRSTML